jgi:flagellin FlaB
MLALKSDSKGDTGIGQMILFIAMILVSAVAAGLFIQTMADLQQQAKNTGDNTMLDVSSGMRVVTATGDRDQDGSGDESAYLESIRITLELLPGSKPLDMENVVIFVTTENENAKLSYGSSADATHFSADEVRDPEGTWTATEKIVSSGALIEVTLDPDVAGLDMVIGEGESFELRIVPMRGTATVLKANTPSVFIDRFVELR